MATRLNGPNGAIAGIAGAASHSHSIAHNAPFRMNLLCEQWYICFNSMLTQPGYQASQVYLTDREREVLKWAATDLYTSEIADRLLITQSTIEKYFASAYRKLGTKTRAAAVLKSIHKGLIRL